MDYKKTLQELKKYIGSEFNFDDLICCCCTDEYILIEEVEGYTSNFENHGTCKLYELYEDTPAAEVFNIWVNDKNIIVTIY